MADKKKKVTTTTVTTVTEEIINVPTNEKTQIICILDRSGSMSSIIKDAIGGFNTFIKSQKELKDEASITVALFDDKYELLYDDVDVQKVNDITNREWMPRGTTALYDAIGKTINEVKKNRLVQGKEAPSKVLCVIVTDGQENASKEYRVGDIKKLIKDCENEDWNFMYLAANQDAFAVSDSFGVSAGNTLNFVATSAGATTVFNTVNASTASYRGMSSYSSDFHTKSKHLISDDVNDLINSGNISVSGDGVINTSSTGTVDFMTTSTKYTATPTTESK